MEENLSNNLCICEEDLRRMIMKKVSQYLRLLKEKDNKFKIKHIKKLYQIYNIFYNMKILIYKSLDFGEDSSTNDFYNFLIYFISCLDSDIIKFIDILQNDKFDNNVLLSSEQFNVYLNLKHFR